LLSLFAAWFPGGATRILFHVHKIPIRLFHGWGEYRKYYQMFFAGIPGGVDSIHRTEMKSTRLHINPLPIDQHLPCMTSFLS
jgi:hypothetical protein